MEDGLWHLNFGEQGKRKDDLNYYGFQQKDFFKNVMRNFAEVGHQRYPEALKFQRK